MTISAISGSLLPVTALSTTQSPQTTSQPSSSTTAESTSAGSQSPAAAADTYTPGIQTGKQLADSLNNAITSLSAQYFASSDASPGSQSANSFGVQDSEDAAAAELAKTQTISSAYNVRLILGSASTMSDPVVGAWTKLNNSVFAGDLSGAQAALTNYTQALQNSNYGMSSMTAPTAQFMSDLTALGTAIQGGDLTQVKTAYLTAQHNTPENAGGAFSTAYDAGNTAAEVSVVQESVANMTDALVALGYTPANAAVEANAMEIAGDTGDWTQGDSDSANTQQSIVGLAEVAAGNAASASSSSNASTTNPAYSIYTAILSVIAISSINANTVSAMNQTLAALDATYGIGNSSGNAGSIAAENPVNAGSSANVNTYA